MVIIVLHCPIIVNCPFLGYVEGGSVFKAVS